MGNALFIVWRESTEAILVVGILTRGWRKHPEARRGMRYLWGGVAAGIGLALALAAVMLGVARLLSEPPLEYFQLAMMIVASGLIVQMVFWMRRHGRTFKRELEARHAETTRALPIGGVCSSSSRLPSAAKPRKRSFSCTASARKRRRDQATS